LGRFDQAIPGKKALNVFFGKVGRAARTFISLREAHKTAFFRT